MAAARHPMPPDIAELNLEEIAERYIGRFRDKTPDWEAFEDAKIEGYRRAQHRFIGAGGSGKHDDPSVIPPAPPWAGAATGSVRCGPSPLQATGCGAPWPS